MRVNEGESDELKERNGELMTRGRARNVPFLR
jgi:hypothetical protein